VPLPGPSHILVKSVGLCRKAALKVAQEYLDEKGKQLMILSNSRVSPHFNTMMQASEFA